MIMDNKKNIVHVEDDVYVVNGKVICFTSDILNMDNPRDVDEVLTLSEVLYVEKGYSAIHGKDTMCVLVKHSDGEHYMISMACILDLPEDVQVKVRVAIDEYIRSSNQIVEIATNVLDKYDIYAVKGKAIAIKNHAFDLNNPLDVSRILSLSDDLFDRDKFLPPIYGNATMAVMVSMENRECAVAMECISDLPDDVAEKLKAVMDEQEKMRVAAVERIKSENQIVEIATDVSGKYDIYVVNGKPIGIEHHVWNMDNPEQLDNIVGIAKDLFCVPDMRAIYGEDTICILTHSGGEYCGGKYCRAALGIHDMSGLPADVVKKVKAAMAL